MCRVSPESRHTSESSTHERPVEIADIKHLPLDVESFRTVPIDSSSHRSDTGVEPTVQPKQETFDEQEEEKGLHESIRTEKESVEEALSLVELMLKSERSGILLSRMTMLMEKYHSAEKQNKERSHTTLSRVALQDSIERHSRSSRQPESHAAQRQEMGRESPD